MNPSITFPVYRKYKNKLSYFKINSDSNFEEIKIMANQGSIHTFNAKILPDRNFIYDMLYNYNEHWEESNELEFNKIKVKFIKS